MSIKSINSVGNMYAYRGRNINNNHNNSPSFTSNNIKNDIRAGILSMSLSLAALMGMTDVAYSQSNMPVNDTKISIVHKKGAINLPVPPLYVEPPKEISMDELDGKNIKFLYREAEEGETPEISFSDGSNAVSYAVNLYEKDEQGRTSRMITYNLDGTVRDFSDYRYFDNGQRQEAWYEPDGNIFRYDDMHEDIDNNRAVNDIYFYKGDGVFEHRHHYVENEYFYLRPDSRK